MALDFKHSKLNVVGGQSHRGLVELITVPAENLRGLKYQRGNIRGKYHREYDTILNAFPDRRIRSKK